MNIYPKTSVNFEGLDKLIGYVEKYKGIELQFFDENGIMEQIDIKTPVEKLLERVPSIKEITIHPPLCNYDIEHVIFKDISIIEEQLRVCVVLARKYNIKINLLYHTQIDFIKHKALTIDKIKDLLKIIEGENVTLLLENLFMFDEQECTVFKLAEYINHPNLKVCFDICHMYCKANIYKTDIESFAKKYLSPEICKKYIYQVHFSHTLNNDGYIDRKTHGRVHDNIEELEYDLNLLTKYGMDKCNYITEVSEDNYNLRVDQLKELDMLEKACQQ